MNVDVRGPGAPAGGVNETRFREPWKVVGSRVFLDATTPEGEGETCDSDYPVPRHKGRAWGPFQGMSPSSPSQSPPWTRT